MNELQVAPNTLPTSSQLQAESARSLAREQRLYANAAMAVRYPEEIRGEIDLYCEIVKTGTDAFYRYERGDSVIEGPNIKLMRAIACAFGYVRSGWRVLEMHDTYCEVQAFAEDMKKGTIAEIEFTVRFWRETQSGGYALRTDRDKYEYAANQASRRVRRCLEDIIPAVYVKHADNQCRKALRSQGTLQDRINAMVEKYKKIGVDKQRLAGYLGHSVESASEDDVVRLARVYRAIDDRITTVDEQFPDELEQKLKGEPSPQETTTKPIPAAKPQTATRSDINALIKIGMEHGWRDESDVKDELRKLGVSKPSDLKKSDIAGMKNHLSHGPRGSWTHMYWTGAQYGMDRADVLIMIQDVTGNPEVAEGSTLEKIEVDAIYAEMPKRANELGKLPQEGERSRNP